MVPSIEFMPLPPGPRLPEAIQTMRWAVRPVPFMERCLREHGEHFTVRLAALGEVVFLAGPEAVQPVFTAAPGLVPAGEGNHILEPVVGPRSLLLLDGAAHLRERRMLLPAFHGRRVAEYASVIAGVADRHIDGWPLGRRFALRPRMQAITLEVIMRAVFGVEAAPALAHLGLVLAGMLDTATGHPLVTMVPALRRDLGRLSPWGRFKRARADFDALVLAQIRARREGGEPAGADVLSLLIEARDEHGRPMTDAEVRDELATLLVAGHETTATALAWALERLMRHPEALARLTRGVESGDDAYLDAVVKETLRLRPVLSIVIRRLAAAMEVDGYELPAGTRVAPCIYLTHRLERLYPDPAAFRPERFLAPNAAPPYAWIPFGGGTRRCLGAGFATLEMKEVLRSVVRRTRLSPAAAESEGIRRRAVTLAPADDALAIMHPRR